jgi:AraC family transcriptional regulator, regulatory protein of adaptative response / methylated-DNA-[protein]-cysteine methyltransferase
MKRKVKNSHQIYEAMRDVIIYVREHAKQRPTIEDMATIAGMSVSRFEHAFSQWTGISPKRFLAHINKEQAKLLLANLDVLKTAHITGLSGPGRLHELMVTHEAVSPGEFKTGNINIRYGIGNSPFGRCLIGITKRGICHLSFVETNNFKKGRDIILKSWPKAELIEDQAMAKSYINKIFYSNNLKQPLRLLIRGSNFQIKVWEALLKIPYGQISTYSKIAKLSGFPKAVRAVGTACGKNSIAYLIPCHRVLTSSGGIGGYRWGIQRKQAILNLENKTPA